MKTHIQYFSKIYLTVILLTYFFVNSCTASEKSIYQALLSYGLSSPAVLFENNTVTISYKQKLSDVSTLDKEAVQLANISKIVSEELSHVDTVNIRQIFDDGQIMQIRVKTGNALDFLMHHIDRDQFLISTEPYPMTRGIRIVSGTCEPSRGDNCRNKQACSCYANEVCLPDDKDSDIRGCMAIHTPLNAHLIGREYVCNKSYVWNASLTDCVLPINRMSMVKYMYLVDDLYIDADPKCNQNKASPGAREVLVAGWDLKFWEKRVYMKFDLSRVYPKNITKATLKLYHNRTGGSDDVNLGVYQVIDAWAEGGEGHAKAGISWANQPAFDPDPVVKFNPGLDANKWVEVDITPLVKKWLEGAANNGLLIKAAEAPGDKKHESQYGFYSREYINSSMRPVLELKMKVDSENGQ